MNKNDNNLMIKDNLKDLLVIDRLEVGPVRLEKSKLVTNYKVVQKGKENSIDLIYKFEENVFNPDDYSSQNLAGLVGAQIALNYGLFCKEIIFHGFFDSYDRNFLKEMMKNTAREIYVKKFLEPNPFLRGAVENLPVIKLDNYVQALIIFSDKTSNQDFRSTEWSTDRSRIAILSSGGKDSLLSFGLLNELGYQVHPIFINESGRHWYTALNAYRYFKETISQTSRVWTNSDRLFSWMLRHLPFVRQDFANVRSDEYPIRLWTVAVFLFGALPLLGKKGISRLVIGDEFDTTRRTSYQGINHYDGLYDQSRYFDNALTRYFMRKHWGITQFSILRPLSELLIQNILVKRYPHLQEHQMSCHAAHIESDRVKPCGHCEKCRRIVGMLKAVDADPSKCGYTDQQIQECLVELSQKGVHQESAGAQHLFFVLAQKGIIPARIKGKSSGKERPEITKIRIEPEMSPIEGIPIELREALYRIFLQYANGSVRRSGRIWIDFNLLDDVSMNQPYPFEAPPLSRVVPDEKGGESKISAKRNYLLAELTWPEAEKRFKEVDVALLPVGAIEQHGPHLPLDTDSFDAQYLAQQVASACSKPQPLVLPLIPYGISYHHEDFKGTISISNDTLSKIVYEVGISAAKHGITKLLIINGHGGNTSALKFAAQMINRDAHIFTTVDTGETSDADIIKICDTPNDVHAGEIETSTALATRPHLVQIEKAKKFVPHFSSHYLNFSSKRGVEWFAHTAKLSQYGVLGDPTKASREKGEKIWKVMIANLVELVEDLKSMTLNEIYEKRY